jgi:uncharacterized protein YbjT (DUF2867 family)
MTRRDAVVGTTGGRGGAVTAALRDAGTLIRGITRRLESPGAQAPGFDDYQTKASRVIPLFELQRA